MLIRKQLRQRVGRVSGYIVSNEPLFPGNFATAIVCVYPPCMINTKAPFFYFNGAVFYLFFSFRQIFYYYSADTLAIC